MTGAPAARPESRGGAQEVVRRPGIARRTGQNPAVAELQEHCVNKIFLIALCAGLVACMNRKKEEEGREPVQTAPAPGPAGG
ncbi:MAG TPA: hypothetical protein VF516_05910, partial [Kofleriaceae bacterium]